MGCGSCNHSTQWCHVCLKMRSCKQLPLRGFRFRRSRNAAPDWRASIRLSITPVSSPSVREIEATCYWATASDPCRKKDRKSNEYAYAHTHTHTHRLTLGTEPAFTLGVNRLKVKEKHCDSDWDVNKSFVRACGCCHLGLCSLFSLEKNKLGRRKTNWERQHKQRSQRMKASTDAHWQIFLFSAANTGELSALYKDLVWSRSITGRSIMA